MTKPIIRVHNIETDEIIDRLMNDDEYQVYLGEQTKEKEEAEIADKTATDKAALLAKLGLTADEAKLLLS